MIYFTPHNRKRKELFPFFPSLSKIFCQRSREGVNNPPHRPQHTASQPDQQPPASRQAPPDPGAGQPEVHRRAQHQAQGDVQPHPAAAQDDAAEEQADPGPGPEQQIQRPAGPPPGQRQAHLPQQVIQQPHPQPHGQAQQQGAELVVQRDAHPRSSRRSRPSRGSSSSS